VWIEDRPGAGDYVTLRPYPPTGGMRASDYPGWYRQLATATRELGGPAAMGIDAWVRRLFAAAGDQRTVVSDPHVLYAGAELRGGELTPGEGARIGAIDFDARFAVQASGRSAEMRHS